MAKWIIGVGAVLALLAVLLWQVLNPSGTSVAKAPRFDAAAAPARDDADLRPRQRSDASVAAAEDEDTGTGEGPELISPTSEEFMHRVDVVIPNQFRARASRCYTGGGDIDRKLKLSYRLRIVDGMVTATNVRVKESTIGDAALQECLIDAVHDLRYRAEDMPDFQEDGELFIRLRSLKKYKPVEEQIREKERNRVIDDRVDDSKGAPSEDIE